MEDLNLMDDLLAEQGDVPEDLKQDLEVQECEKGFYEFPSHNHSAAQFPSSSSSFSEIRRSSVRSEVNSVIPVRWDICSIRRQKVVR